MPGQRTTFGKLQRDRAKKAKAAAKRERREAAATSESDADATSQTVQPAGPSTEELLAEIEQLHQQFDDARISYEEFEERKAGLLARLTIE